MIDFGATLRKMGLITACVALMGLVGCKAPALDPETDAVARATYNQVRTGAPDLQTHLTPELKAAPSTATELARIKGLIPPGEPSLGTAVGWNYVSMLGQGKAATMAHEYDYPGRVVLANVALSRPEGAKAWLVSGFHVQVATTEELKALNFNLTGKSYVHYAFLAGFIASLGLILAAVVKVVRTQGLKRKWLWLIASFFTVIGFQINWFNGAVTWKLNFGLLNAGFLSGGSRFDPWVLFFALPVGAILILTGIWAKPKPVPVPDATFQ